MVRFITVTRLQPTNAEAHQNLGLFYAQNGKLTEAISQFEQALQLQPDAQAWYNLGLARVVQGNLRAAVTNYQQAVKLKPDWPTALNDLAWLLATAPDPDLRNGPEAVHLAEKARDLNGGKDAQFWGTLDAAYAEAGRFDDATRTAEKARDLAIASSQTNLATAAEQRLALYRDRKPYRQ
jgi:Flp pilus assembly protein TadD